MIIHTQTQNIVLTNKYVKEHHSEVVTDAVGSGHRPLWCNERRSTEMPAIFPEWQLPRPTVRTGRLPVYNSSTFWAHTTRSCQKQ